MTSKTPDQIRKYKRDWMRQKRAAHPGMNTVAGGRPSRARKPKRIPGQCIKCGEVFPQTSEFFVTIKKTMKDGRRWEGFATECRPCRNGRFTTHYAENRESQIQRVMDYHKLKPEKVRARNMKRYARKVHATPAWADQRKIETIYAIADFLTRRTGVLHQVDHYYPIMGKTSCGLHTEANLRVIPAKANQAKGNREPTPPT